MVTVGDMSVKKWWVASVAVASIAVVSVASAAVISAHRGPDLIVTAPETPTAPQLGVAPAQADGPLDTAALTARLDELANNPDLGDFSGVVSDVGTGEIVWERGGDNPLQPASVTKVLTGAAALWELGEDHRVTTTVLRQADTAYIVSEGDVWLDDQQLDQLAAAAQGATAVVVDTTAWGDNTFLDSWDRQDIAAGYIAPMEPLMRYGGRLSGTEGDTPRTDTPALAVGEQIAQRIGGADVRQEAAPKAEEEGVSVAASITSAPLIERLEELMAHSDNVMAEAVGREIARHRHPETPPDSAQAAKAVTEIVQEHGIDTTGLDLHDTSGLSTDNRIPPRVIDTTLAAAVIDPKAHGLSTTLPIAGASGTLAERFNGTPGAGWVRAKTGTLTSTSALAGVVTAADDHILSFAFISNGSSILPARQALDALATGIRG